MDFTTFQIDPIAFAIGPIVIRWYALAYLAGFLVGWKYCVKLAVRSPDTRPNAQDIDDFLTWAVIGVILGGRFGYVMFYNLDYYMSEPLEALKIWRGGMSFHGGVLGVMLAMIGYSKVYKVGLFRLSDIVCAAAPIGLFFGRIANFINAELYGRPTDLPWGVKFPGTNEPRHPSQLYEALLEGLILFIILYFVMRLPKTIIGLASGVFLMFYGIFRILIEFVREPDVQIGLIGNSISMGQILCLPMIFGGLFIIIFAIKNQDHAK